MLFSVLLLLIQFDQLVSIPFALDRSRYVVPIVWTLAVLLIQSTCVLASIMFACRAACHELLLHFVCGSMFVRLQRWATTFRKTRNKMFAIVHRSVRTV